ncbi:dipeptide ABC transporter ATP-binding protein [Nocardia jinanensis]|uniref:ABC transporter ATP-binding protein n=1 Tax=Nocardia jinanensis TaxID=382504 RepID=A0A917RDX5_9NOCA|nr:ABC transporter ATP-binding protein [Nocardia jinanensis]GGL02961.1 ABC transporter ATP-binding protein [Nocardia jinanensis]
MAVLTVENLAVSFSQRGEQAEAVRGVSFSVEPGRTLGIVGESGSGKSVSLLAATGLLGPDALVRGRAVHQGIDLIAADRAYLRSIRGKEIGFVFQDPQSNLHPLIPIGRQIGEAITAHGRVQRAQLRARVLELLDEVEIPRAADRIDDHPVHLSGGMRQRVMIAIAIACNPGLVIADEPTTALDVTVQASILSLLERLRRDHGTALVFVSHDLAVVSDIADDVLVMRDGAIVEADSARSVYTAPKSAYTRSLLAAHRTLGRPSAERSNQERSALLRVTGVTKSFRTRAAPLLGGVFRRSASLGIAPVLNGIDFEIGAGEIVGLVGESGSGKSTIGRIVAGLDRPDAGTVSLGAKTYITPGSGRAELDAEVRRSVQVVFQDPYGSLNPRRRISEILAAPYRLAGHPREQSRHEAEALITRVGLPADFLHRYPGQLSGGQRQRVAIARAVALGPALVVADEPASALDVTTQDHILALLRNLRDESGTSLLFISHDLGVVAAICDRVLVLREGVIVEQGPTGTVFAAPRHDYTRLLLESVPGRRRREAVDV